MKTIILKNSGRIIQMGLVVCLLLSASLSFAGEKLEIISGETFTIRSAILNEERVISVYLPDAYNTTSNDYPVLYVLDGRAHFTHAIAATNFLSTRRLIPPMIVISIHNVDRNRDFSPVETENIPNGGGAEKFLNFVSGELIPYINENYRSSDFTVLMGHSFGGAFAAYALLAQPEVFDGYIAISPYLQFADNHLVKESMSMLKMKYDHRKYFYMTVGDEPDFYPVLSEFASNMRDISGDAIEFNYNMMETEDHNSVPYISLFKGLRFIFSGWQLPPELMEKGLSEIDNHYKNLSSKYDFEVHTPENTINLLGYRYLQNNEIDRAIEVFKENVKRYPNSANVYDSLGEAYENNEQFELAKKNYQKAYDQGVIIDDPNRAIYKRNLDRMNEN